MSSSSEYIVQDNSHINTTDQPTTVLSCVQSDHSYCRHVVNSELKEDEYDDLKVVEIIEQVDVSMHIDKNGVAYLQDANGVWWNSDSFRLNDLPWKPTSDFVKTESTNDIVKTEPTDNIVETDSQVDDDHLDSVKIVKNCVKCKAPLSSGALCVKCNQPWVALTDFYKTKDFIDYKQIITEDDKIVKISDPKKKRFYVLKKSDVEKFVDKKKGMLNIINEYEASKHKCKMNATGRDMRVNNTGTANNISQSYFTSSNQVENCTKESGQVVLSKDIPNRDNVTNKHCTAKQKEIKFNFIQKLVSVNIDSLKVKNKVREKNVDVTRNKVNATNVATFIRNEIDENNVVEESNMGNIKISGVRGNVDPKLFLTNQTQQNEIKGNVNKEETCVIRTKRKSTLNHTILNKNIKLNSKVDESKEKDAKFQNKKSPVQDNKFICVACDDSFPRYQELLPHMVKHKAPFGCLKCKLKLLSETELIAHSIVHNVIGRGPFQCRVCNKELNNLNLLRAHSFEHVKEAYSCEKCGVSFCSALKLTCHLAMHEALPYTCKFCKRQFKRPGYLTRHYCPQVWS